MTAPFLLPAAIGAAGELLGGGISAFGQASANQANREIAEEQMRFQERMSSTAWQRSVADMRKAGINPIFGAAGASTPGGAGIPMQSVGRDAGQAVMGAASSAAQIVSTLAQAHATLMNAGTGQTSAAVGNVARDPATGRYVYPISDGKGGFRFVEAGTSIPVAASSALAAADAARASAEATRAGIPFKAFPSKMAQNASDLVDWMQDIVRNAASAVQARGAIWSAQARRNQGPLAPFPKGFGPDPLTRRIFK